MDQICVIGLGRIGLAKAIVLCEANFKVIGVEKRRSIISKIQHAEPSLADPTMNALVKKHFGKNFIVTSNLNKALEASTAVIVAVSTGIKSDRTPELSTFWGLIRSLSASSSFRQPRLYIFKSTLPVGTTRRTAQYFEQKTGLKCGKDFFLAYCPERVLGDKILEEIRSLPKIVGGYDKNSTEQTVQLYKKIGGTIIDAGSPEAAELIKLADNAFRQTLFAFANDLALIAEQEGINAFDLIRAANESYPRNNIPKPSGGVSGLCLTKDPMYLESSFSQIAATRGFSSVWYAARESNNYMPHHVASLVKARLKEFGRNVKGSNVLICGISYKENIDDTRMSHGLQIAAQLQRSGAGVSIWDPCVSKKTKRFRAIVHPSEVIKELDALVFTVKHPQFLNLRNNGQLLELLEEMRTPIVVECSGMFQELLKDKNSYACVGVSCKSTAQRVNVKQGMKY